MTSKAPTLKPLKGNNMSDIKPSGMKSLVGRKMTKKYEFMGEKVTISKLSVAEVMDIQEKARTLSEETAEQDDSGIALLMMVIQSAVEGADELTKEDFESFPMDELSKLSQEIMVYSGIDQARGK